jgi:hypothetical protein
MIVGVGFCKIKVDSNFLLVLKVKCTKFHQDRSKTVDLHIKYTNRHSVLYMYIDLLCFILFHRNVHPTIDGHKKLGRTSQLYKVNNYKRTSCKFDFFQIRL